MFEHLEELHIFNTPLSEEAKARLLMTLKKLTSLVRGDFLADALGWIDYLDEIEAPKVRETDWIVLEKFASCNLFFPVFFCKL